MLFVIDGDPRELAAFERLMRRCCGADYRVMGEPSPGVGLDGLVADNIVWAYAAAGGRREAGDGT